MRWEEIKMAYHCLVVFFIVLLLTLIFSQGSRLLELEKRQEQLEQRFDKLEKIIIDKALEQLSVTNNQ